MMTAFTDLNDSSLCLHC